MANAGGAFLNALLARALVLGEEPGEYPLAIENPAGVLETLINARQVAGELLIDGAAYRRSAQILLQGSTPLYNASAALLAALPQGQ